MPKENLEIVRGAIEGNRSGAPGVDVTAQWDPECELVSVMGDVDQETYRGHDGLRRYLVDMANAWQEWHIEIEELSEVRPDVVLATLRPHLIAKQTGMPLEGRVATVFELSDGKIVRAHGYKDWHEALEAVGVSE